MYLAVVEVLQAEESQCGQPVQGTVRRTVGQKPPPFAAFAQVLADDPDRPPVDDYSPLRPLFADRLGVHPESSGVRACQNSVLILRHANGAATSVQILRSTHA